MCVCSLICQACTAHAPGKYCRLWPVRLYSIFPHYLIRTPFSKKLLHIKCVFWFSLQFASETFLTVSRTGRDMIKNLYWSSGKVFFSDFNETWIFSTIFEKILKYRISWKSFQWEPELVHADGRTDTTTDMTKLMVAFRKFCEGVQKAKGKINFSRVNAFAFNYFSFWLRE